MRKQSFASFASLLILVALAARPALAVNEGTVDDGNPPRFPNVKAYVVVSQRGVPIEPFQFGSVSLVSPRVVLTAGHVTDVAEAVIAFGLFELGDARISFGTDPLDPKTWLAISDIVTHPDFQLPGFGRATENDIGLVVLAEPVEGIEPVALAPVGYLDALKASGALQGKVLVTVVGYGAMREFPPVRDVENHLRRYTDAVLGGVTKKWLTLLQNPIAHGGGVNNGDSGGPAFWTEADGGLVQVGVASTAWDAALNHHTRVDVAANRKFIDAVIEDVAEEDGE